MTIRIVQSKQNPRIKALRAALLRPGRGVPEYVGLEGVHLIQEALRGRLALEAVFVIQDRQDLLQSLNLDGSVEVLAVPREALESAVSTESPQPIAALAKPFDWIWRDLLEDEFEREPLIVVLAGIQDPGNLGAILRSAEAFGATGAVCLPGTVSPWNPKAMRASAGSVFRLPLVQATAPECFHRLREARVRTLAAMPQAAEPLDDPSVEKALAGPVALAIGAEGSGLAPEIAAQCDARVTIPCPGPVESLNAAVAASILLYEASRQRACAARGGKS